jgi:hypothetical protein
MKKTKDEATGTYIFDKKLGKVVKVSSQIPSVAAKASARPACGIPEGEGSPCGTECGGACPMGDFN